MHSLKKDFEKKEKKRKRDIENLEEDNKQVERNFSIKKNETVLNKLTIK